MCPAAAKVGVALHTSICYRTCANFIFSCYSWRSYCCRFSFSFVMLPLLLSYFPFVRLGGSGRTPAVRVLGKKPDVHPRFLAAGSCRRYGLVHQARKTRIRKSRKNKNQVIDSCKKQTKIRASTVYYEVEASISFE